VLDLVMVSLYPHRDLLLHEVRSSCAVSRSPPCASGGGRLARHNEVAAHVDALRSYGDGQGFAECVAARSEPGEFR
jgi:hypothetical protein